MEVSVSSTYAIVIAMPTGDPHFAEVAPGGQKSLIPIGGRPAIAHLIGSLRASGSVERVIVVGDKAVLDAASEADVRVPAHSTESASVMAGIAAADGADRCLVMTGDMPLAAAEAVADFLNCAPDADVVYPVTSKEDVEELFPTRKTSYVKAKEGRFTGSSCLLFRKDAALAREKMLVELLEARKNPTALLGLIGPVVGLKIMLSTLSLREFERHLSEGLGMECRVFITHYPELLFSLDSPEDVYLASASCEA